MEEGTAPDLEDNTIRALYEASLNGCVSTLDTLIQSDPLILSRVSLSPFPETPLHIAALLGHLEFCEALLERKPNLASEMDSEGRCPLHLAAAEGHTEVVKALLLANSDVCLALDKVDRIPLHLAVTRGRMGAIKELISARPDSIREMIDDDGSVFHLSVRYNHLEALKYLVESVSGDQQFLIAKDEEGNTVLHLAVKLRQIKTIKYLLSQPEIRTAANALNNMGLTALDVLERYPRDFIGLRIQDLLIEAGTKRSEDLDTREQPPPATREDREPEPRQSRRRIRLKQFWVKHLQYEDNWIEETRGTLMVVATVIATMTFQSTISPPGGVWQENTLTGGFNCTAPDICEAGTAVLAYAWTHDFLHFMTFNTTSFFSSLFVLLLLISGLPLKNKVMMWTLIIAMSVAVTFMALTYIWALGLVSPYRIIDRVYGMDFPLAYAWGAILLVVGLIHTIRLFVWIKERRKKKLHRPRRMSSKIRPLNENHPVV